MAKKQAELLKNMDTWKQMMRQNEIETEQKMAHKKKQLEANQE